MEEFNFKIDEQSGLPYLENLPEGYRVATLDDFHVKGNKKTGMTFILKSFAWPVYHVKKLTNRMTGAQLRPFIDAGHVFVKEEPKT